MVALEDGLTAKLSLNACEYCVNGDGIWKALPANTETETIKAGQTLSFRGNLTPTSSDGIGTFTVNKYFNLKGNCMSMLFGDEAKNEFSLNGKNYALMKLFLRCTKLIDASELALQPTVLSYCCYQSSFNGCTSLIASPKLPATKIYGNCYNAMFYGCTNLTEAPELPAMTLETYCYNAMFNSCVSLTKAPKLLAPVLTAYCYINMFMNCEKLDYIKMLATDISATSCLTNWVVGVASLGTFVKNKDATWDNVGISGIPEGWTVITE